MIWNNYKNFLYNTLDMKVIHSSNHTNKNSHLESKLYSGEYVLKSRETYVESGDNEFIYNNIIYPKTGKNLPCFGIDLMAFMEKKVIIVFDFQHPLENYDFNDTIVENTLKDYAGITKDIRFFQPGNHFSRYIYVKKCTIHEVDNYLDDFKKYVNAYNDLLTTYKPSELNNDEFVNFDTYMHKLDPVIGFMEIRFGKEFAENYVNNFLFSYAKVE